MPSWALRTAAAVSTLLVFMGAVSYTAAHVKNPAAPLQPPVAPAATGAAAAGAPGTSTPGSSGRVGPSPTPRISLAPGVRGATLPPITFTHVS
ncbi:MAG: hypothetical protein ABR525_01080 [Candidatus Limnocylindria bacterium]